MNNIDYTMTIFDYHTFRLLNTVYVYDVNLSIDEETNKNSNVKTLTEINSKRGDIVYIKKDGETIYIGIVDNISLDTQNFKEYTYTLKYITNLFDYKIPLNYFIDNLDDVLLDTNSCYIKIRPVVDNSKVLRPKLDNKNSIICFWDDSNNDSNIWLYTEVDSSIHKGYLTNSKFTDRYVDLEGGYTDNGTRLKLGTNDRHFTFTRKRKNVFSILNVASNKYIDMEDGMSANGTKAQIWEYSATNIENREYYLEYINSATIWNTGIEMFIKLMIENNFVYSSDTFSNLDYIDVICETQTPMKISVENVENNLFNLHTFMTNMTQQYNIKYKFKIEKVNGSWKFRIYIKRETDDKIILNEDMIFNVEQVLETDIVSKVVCYSNLGADTYSLFLKIDRTTTTDSTDPDRAEGKTEIIYTDNPEDMANECLNVIKGNSYNHNITFESFTEYNIGQPIAIRTKNQVIEDTYISSKEMTENKSFKYQCGNIRINFLEKLLQERRN